MRCHRSDLSASITVFLIAVPLSLGIALATGAPLQSGLVAAAVGGIVAGLLGGAPLQVSGGATSLVVITAGLVERYGWRATCAITVLAGLAQLLLGGLRVARAALAVSPAIVHGMLAGIGTVIAVGQLHVVLGGSPQISALANIAALPDQLMHSHPITPVIGAVTVGVLLGWPRLRGRARALRAVPAPLAAVALATAVSAAWSVPRVDLPRLTAPGLPVMPGGPVSALVAAVLTVTLVASMEALLSAVAVDALQARRPGPHAPRPASTANCSARVRPMSCPGCSADCRWRAARCVAPPTSRRGPAPAGPRCCTVFGCCCARGSRPASWSRSRSRRSPHW